jgi:cytoskeletal protein CcmA (bactofilin family)
VNFDLSVVPQIITAPTIQSNLTLTNGTKSVSTTTGALIVGGGVGIRGDVNVGGVLHIFNGTQSTGTGTGALIVDGGVSVGKRLSAESVKIADTVLDSGLILVNTTATTIVDVYSVNDYRAAKYLIQIDSGSGPTADFQVIEILLLVDNIQTVYATEYGVLTTNGELGEFAADVQNDNNVRLYFTPYQATDKAISVLRTGMVV